MGYDPLSPDDDIIHSYGITRPTVMSPERQLWIKVLEFALDELGTDPDKILEWIDSDDFKFICKAVGVRPKTAAAHLRDIYGRLSGKERG